MVLLLPVVALTAVANAQTFRGGSDMATVDKDEKINSSVWAAGTFVEVAGTVDGDVYCAGQNIKVTGTVKGDVLCAGQTVSVSGIVEGDVRAAGQAVSVSGKVDGSVTLLGQTLAIEDKAVVGRDVSFAGQDITLQGEVMRDVVIAAETATISAAIGRDVSAQVSQLTVAGATVIGGNLGYSSQQKAGIGDNAMVKGETTYTQWKETERQDTMAGFGATLLWAGMLYASALLIALLFPRMLHRATNGVVKTPAKALTATVIGLVVSIVIPISAILLAFTLFAIPFVLVALVAWVLIFSLSGAVAAYYLGRVLWRRGTNAIGIMALGAFVVLVACMLPYVGLAVFLLAAWFGSGTILMELKSRMATPVYDTKLLNK